MSRGGANPNWEWQLIRREGHTSDSGLRQRSMVEKGHQGAREKLNGKKKPARKVKAFTALELARLFEPERRKGK